MSVLSTVEKQRFEDLFGMGSGYVLNFTDQSFAEFFRQAVGINIYDLRYAYKGTSKAKRLRSFWEIEEPTTVGRALEQLLELWRYLNEPGKDERADGKYEAVLEKALHTLCDQQQPPVPLKGPKGEFKSLAPLIDGLKKAGAFNEARSKQLRAWADLWNLAAHGEFTQFKRNDVEAMISGINNFLADFLK
jgi:hypothetical protein